MDYKKIFKTREARARVLRALRFIPDGPMLHLQYWLKTGRHLHLRQPKRFTEKLQWYKMYYRDPVMHICADKYAVRDYVRSKGLGDILVPLYAKFSSVDEVAWDKLPDRFVMKTTNGGGGLSVVVCPDKAALDIDEVRRKLTTRKIAERSGGREWAYYGIEPGIVVEELLINEDNPDAGVNDYKFFCYGGRAKFVIVDTDRYIGHKRNFYDMDWNDLHITSDCPACDREIEKPANFAQMRRAAEILSADFPYVRVDLYSVGEKVYFGELTFYPWSGYVQYTPDEADFLFGKDFVLEKYGMDGSKKA